MKIKKHIALIRATILSYAVTAAVDLHVTLPDTQGYRDIQTATNGQSEIVSNPNDLISIIRLINEYLRIAVGVICMVVLVVSGIKLIGTRGDEATMKKTANTIIGAIVGIVMAVFAYIIVRSVLNLF